MLPIQSSSSSVDQWGAFTEAIQTVFTPEVIILIVLSISLGIILGAIPGLGAVLGMTIVLPLTIVMDGTTALIMLVSIYSGALYGASISAILINVPGTAAAAATTFDGYPMTRRGESWKALEISGFSSAVGGAITMVLLFFLIPYLEPIVIAFGAPQVFLLALFGVVMIGVIAGQGSLFKGITAGLAGILAMTIGVSPSTPQVRFNVIDSLLLFDGLNLVAIMIGMFALGEMLRIADMEGTITADKLDSAGQKYSGIKETVSNKILVIKSAIMGMFIGAIPGIGGATANFFSYAEAVRTSQNPDEYGEGNPQGVIAAEASNNAVIAGSLIPVISFGIPGSASTAVLLGGFIMHGLNPGIEMLSVNLDITYSMIIALLLGNVVILGLSIFVVTRVGYYITRIDTNVLIPVILVLSFIGTIGIRSNWIDVISVLLFGILAFYMKIYDYSMIAFVLGTVLSLIIESNFQRSMQLGNGSPIIFVNDPLSLALVAMIILFTIATVILPIMRSDEPGM